ncbi:MAG: Dihydroneopterin triphosphate 2'-epimerase [Anaerolineales bacterium]|nr:Dihydroneopterin triphosphate 2'-epimerase [Anaerolineales bacterium]
MTGTLDKIRIRDLVVRAIVGVNPDERANRQDVLINLTLYLDTRRAGQSDKIAGTVNYRTVTRRVIQHVEASNYYLVEALASNIARIILAEFPVERVRVSVEKPGALRAARSVGVEIEREREGAGERG